MKTPQDVGKYRFSVIKKMLAGEISMEAALDIQKMTDAEIAYLIRREK